MEILVILVPLALMLGGAGLAAFLWSLRSGQYDDLDGVTIQFKDWWFNVRPSNTEPLLRLNVEAKTADLLDEKLTELEDFLGMPVDY